MRYGLFFYRGKSVCPTEDDYSLDFWYVGVTETSRYDSPVRLQQQSINEASNLILMKIHSTGPADFANPRAAFTIQTSMIKRPRIEFLIFLSFLLLPLQYLKFTLPPLRERRPVVRYWTRDDYSLDLYRLAWPKASWYVV